MLKEQLLDKKHYHLILSVKKEIQNDNLLIVALVRLILIRNQLTLFPLGLMIKVNVTLQIILYF